jgi:hypothetical protein
MRRMSILAVVAAAALGASVLALTLSGGSSVRRSLVYEVDGSIWRANVNGRHPGRLASGTDPQVSPDGRLVAFLRTTATRRMFLHGGYDTKHNGPVTVPSVAAVLAISARGGPATAIAEVDPANPDLVWAPDSRHLAIGSAKGLYVLDCRTGSHELIARQSLLYPSYSPSFSPDSSSLVYTIYHRRDDDLHIADLASGRARQITHLGDARSPLWGAKKIAFSHARGIWVLGSGGRHLRQLVSRYALADGYAAPIAWSASGGRLLLSVSSFRPDNRFKTVDGASGEVGYSGLGDPLGLSRDGSTVITGSCGGPFNWRFGSIKAVPVSAGKPRTIAKRACSASWNA